MALDYSALGKRISNFRNASGFTQEQFCEKLNMSRKHISQIEAATSRPSLEALVDIANLLCISADDLLVDSLTHSASLRVFQTSIRIQHEFQKLGTHLLHHALAIHILQHGHTSF